MSRFKLQICVVVLGVATSSVGVGEAAPPVSAYSESELLKNWALARCLSRAFPKSVLEPDAAATAAGYLERGSVDADAYAEIAKLAQRFLDRTYASQSGQPLQTMKCIDLFYSSELAQLIRRYSGKRHPR